MANYTYAIGRIVSSYPLTTTTVAIIVLLPHGDGELEQRYEVDSQKFTNAGGVGTKVRLRKDTAFLGGFFSGWELMGSV